VNSPAAQAKLLQPQLNGTGRCATIAMARDAGLP